MQLKGKVWKFGRDIDTDAIIPARYLNTADPVELARHVMEDADKDFPTKVRAGDVIVAGANFGCGSSREHAPIALKASGLSAIVAGSFARIFYRNAFNIGLPIFESPEAVSQIKEGDVIEIDTVTGVISNTITGVQYQAKPIPPFMEELINAGGLIQWTRNQLGLVLGG
ncbi:3-isopropylmalate dehydratase small subunit [Candidatus Magnetobacterium casense]|uniref:3-isopropylmalate dehydratase small subunit n=1 Tax=Candidatus Magnetobacterium casense TaxID=1455061 RepID=A0ABS6RXY9_9BACT|nr:3-isopropylmalate dehydratase small subunit [Candidatus Magnetobacterium casensis]MBV6341488.1 3-isopropylmalate dehydratase small subunit [Candidatus Magnetobacterium casensis]